MIVHRSSRPLFSVSLFLRCCLSHECVDANAEYICPSWSQTVVGTARLIDDFTHAVKYQIIVCFNHEQTRRLIPFSQKPCLSKMGKYYKLNLHQCEYYLYIFSSTVCLYFVQVWAADLSAFAKSRSFLTSLSYFSNTVYAHLRSKELHAV